MKLKRDKNGALHITHNGRVDTKTHNTMIEYAKTLIFWSKPTVEQSRAIKAKLATISKTITYDQFMSLRAHVIKNYIIGNYNRVNGKLATCAAAYDSGTSILALSEQYKHPPVDLLRLVFIQKGYKAVTSIINGSQLLPSTRDNHELSIAKQNDMFFDEAAVLQSALDYEAEIERQFIQHKVKYKTQEVLTTEQSKRYGAAVSTPDFAFLEPVYFNGHRIYWLDVKNYYYVPGFLSSKLQQQGEKYDQLWGPGALLFRYGYSATVPHVMCF